MFSGGYYLLILVIVLNIVVLRKHVGEEVKGFFKYSKKTLYQKEVVTNNQILCQTNNLFGQFGQFTHFQTLNLDDKKFLTLKKKIDRLRRLRKQRTDEKEGLLQVHNL